MSIDNAKSNLEEFGKELGLKDLEFDENNTCILGIDDQFSMHLTYEPNTNRLYIYSPILDGLPKDDEHKLALYERLLEGSMLGGQMAGGGVGVAVNEELILLHCTIDMAYAESIALKAFAPLYVETVEKWRKIALDLSEGREPDADVQDPKPSGGDAPSSGPGGQAGLGGGQGFIKI